MPDESCCRAGDRRRGRAAERFGGRARNQRKVRDEAIAHLISVERKGALTSLRARNLQRRKRCTAKIGIEDTAARGADDVARTGDRKCRYRGTAGERLEHHEAECVGPARVHQNIGGRVDLWQRLAFDGSEKADSGIALSQTCEQRAATDDQF